MAAKRLTAKKGGGGYSIFYGDDRIGFTEKMDDNRWHTYDSERNRFTAETRGDAMEMLLTRFQRLQKSQKTA